MIKKIIHDGDVFNPSELGDFLIDNNNDITKVKRIDTLSGEEQESCDYRVSFVGFVTNKNNDLLLSLPKHYKVEERYFDQDCSILFKAISKYHQKRKTNYVGAEEGEEWVSNYPFSSFFGVYDYFVKHGLYFDKQDSITQKQTGKINWKETIRLSKKYVVDNKVVMFPFFRKASVTAETFLTICMAFIIDYTVEKFGSLLDIQPIEYEIPNIDLNSGRRRILDELLRLKKRIFNDEKINLVQNMINFFSQLNEGGSYYLKHYNFAAIWETSVREYISNHFDGVLDGKVLISKSKVARTVFDKPIFKPNLAKPEEFFQPDCYFADNNVQCILDAKYYLNVSGIMYKELSYVLLMKNYRESIDGEPKYNSTICALLLPSEERKTRLNFKMSPLFNKDFSDIVIFEEYFDIKEILLEFIK